VHRPLEWITLTKEEPVDPYRPIVDAHHHLHQAGTDKQIYLLEDQLSHTRSGHNVTHTVFVEAGTGFRPAGPEALRPVGETEFVAAQARQSDQRATRVAAIIPFADLTLGEGLDEVLEAHETAGEGRFRGVRHATTWDASPEIYSGGWSGWTDPPRGLMAESSFRRGVARLDKRGCLFEAYLYHPQIPDLVSLAESFEDMTMVLDHMGMPLNVGPYQDRDSVRSEWRNGLRLLASCPNTVIKLGGMGMDTWFFGAGWASRQRPPGSDDVVDYWGEDIMWCIDTLGPSRCMFESNYPVDRATLDYTVIWNAFQKIAASYSDEEQDDLFAGTAARVYQIDLDPRPQV
jgi:predicted TIM-barrel fold metal-dependent hydrolase